MISGTKKSSMKYKPNSFFVAGGPDLDGNFSKSDPKALTSEAEEDADVWQSLYGSVDGDLLIYADPFYDPRHDVFSIADLASEQSFKDAVKSASEQLEQSRTPQE